MSLLNNIKKVFKAKEPWKDLESNFKLHLICEECSLDTNILFNVNEEFNCEECNEAKILRDRLKETEGWE